MKISKYLGMIMIILAFSIGYIQTTYALEGDSIDLWVDLSKENISVVSAWKNLIIDNNNINTQEYSNWLEKRKQIDDIRVKNGTISKEYSERLLIIHRGILTKISNGYNCSIYVDEFGNELIECKLPGEQYSYNYDQIYEGIDLYGVVDNLDINEASDIEKRLWQKLIINESDISCDKYKNWLSQKRIYIQEKVNIGALSQKQADDQIMIYVRVLRELKQGGKCKICVDNNGEEKIEVLTAKAVSEGAYIKDGKLHINSK